MSNRFVSRRAALTGIGVVGAGAAVAGVTGASAPQVAAAASPAVTTESDVGNYWQIQRRPYLVSLTAGADNTAAINAAIANAQPYDTVTIPPGDWTHLGVLRHAAADVNVVGYGARLLGTDPTHAGYLITGDRATVRGINHTVVGAGGTRGNGDNLNDCPWVISGAAETVLEDVQSIGARDAAFFLDGAIRARLRNISGRDSLADGLHFTNGSRDCVADGVTLLNPGDDGVAVVSYTNDAKPCYGITVSRARVVNGLARGFSVAGGESITYQDIDVTRCQAAAYYVAHEQGDFNTRPVTAVRMFGGNAQDADWGSADQGAVCIVNLVSGTIMTDVVLAGLVCTDIRKTNGGAPYAKVGTSAGSGGRLKGVALQDITLQGGTAAKPLYTDGVNNTTITSGAFKYAGGSGTGVTATTEGFTVSGAGSQVAASGTTTGAPGFTATRVRSGGSWATV